MRDIWRRIVGIACAGAALLSALPTSASAAGKLAVRGGGELSLGVERVLEVDLGNKSLSGKRTVTLSGYLDAVPEEYVSDGLVLRLDGLEGAEEGSWTDRARPGERVRLGKDSRFEDGALALHEAVRLPEAAARALAGGTYTVEYFVDQEGYSGAKTSPAPLLTSGGWKLQTGRAGQSLSLTPGSGTQGVTADFDKALGGPCAITASGGGSPQGGWYRDGDLLSAFTPAGQTGGASLTLGSGGEDFQARVYSLRIYNRALTGAELRANAALDRSRFLGEAPPELPDLTVNGAALDPGGKTALTLTFEDGLARLPIVSRTLGSMSLTLTAGDRSVQVELQTVSALERALELCPGRLSVTVPQGASALEIRTEVAKKVETAIAESGFTQAGGRARVTGGGQKDFAIQLTGEGRSETLPLKVTVTRREDKGGQPLEALLSQVQRGFFAFEKAEEITAEAIAAQAAEMLGDDGVTASARWDEEALCWYLRLERGEESAEAPLYLNSRVELAFDSPALLDSCRVRAVMSDDAYVAGGTLNVTGTAGNTYEAVVLPVWNYGRNFCIEAEVRMSGAVSDSRWCGLAFGVRPGASGKADQFAFWQMAMRWDTSANNGLECAQMLPGGAWNPRRTASLPQRVDPQRTYRLTILYEDGVVCQYVDGALVLRSDVPDASSVDGKLAFTFDGATAELLSLRVSEELPDLPTEQTLTPNGYDAKLYEPRTGLVMSPTVVAEQPVSAAAVARETRRPATLVKTVRPDLTVEDGGTAVPVAEYLRRLDRRALAGLRIEDIQTAAAFARYAAANGIVDVNVFSSSGAVLQTACGGRAGVRGVLDLSSAMPDQLSEAVFAANRAGARVVVIPQRAADREAVKYLQTRAVSVWVRADPEDPFAAILSGADGIVTSDYAAALDAIESFGPGGRVLTRATVVTAHRGIHQNAPENTERAAALAVKAGAEAIECDVHLSADGVVMVSHDGGTGALMDRNLYISQSTREQLQGLTFRRDAQPGDRMPTLAQLFQAAAGTDMVFLVEVKSLDPKLIPPLVKTVRESGMVHRVVFLSFEEVQLQRVRAQMPEASVGLLDACTQSGLDTAANLKSMADRLDPLNAFYSCPQEVQSPELTRAARHRGLLLHPWTVDEYELFEQKYYDGYHGFTTDRADFATYYLSGAEAERARVFTQSGADGAVSLRVEKQFREGTVTAQADGFLQISGDAEVRRDGEGRLWSEKPGTAVVLLSATYTLPATQVPYTMYTLPVTLVFS